MEEDIKSQHQFKIAIFAYVAIEAIAIGILVYKLW